MALLVADEHAVGGERLTAPSEREPQHWRARGAEVDPVDVAVVGEAERHRVEVRSDGELIRLFRRHASDVDQATRSMDHPGDHGLVIGGVGYQKMPAVVVVPEVDTSEVTGFEAVRTALNPMGPGVVVAGG